MIQSEIILCKSNKENYKEISKFTWVNGKSKTTVRVTLCKNWHWVKFSSGTIHKTDHVEIHTTKWKDPHQREVSTPITGKQGYRSFFLPKVNPKSFIKELHILLNDPKALRKFNKKIIKEAA
tara:strand:- start:379 stop:744 length:366 start_codon:yes stop_codon:yes gene_type:complete